MAIIARIVIMACTVTTAGAVIMVGAGITAGMGTVTAGTGTVMAIAAITGTDLSF